MALEANVEQAVVVWAENNGWQARKMAYAGRRGCRDHDFYGYGLIVPVEFKQRGKGLDLHQEKERHRLAQVGVTVHVIDSVEAGVALLQSKMPG
jgi:hypothetical protein